MVAACAPRATSGAAAPCATPTCAGSFRDQSPTLVLLIGTDDPVTTVADGEALRDGIPRARLATLRAAHLSNIEQADAFTAAVSDFLSAREVTS